MRLNIFTDGGSRGNPGQAACAFVAENEVAVLKQGSELLGITTNNEAEYRGFLLSLGWLEQFLADSTVVSSIVWMLDSKLVVEQLNRRWKIKEPRMKSLANECWTKLSTISVSFSIRHIPREKNAVADALLNKTLDAIS